MTVAPLRSARGYQVALAVFIATLVGLVVVAFQSPLLVPSRISRLIWEEDAQVEQPVVPAGPEYTAAVVYLISLDRMEELPESLGKAQRHVVWREQWPIVLFHTGEFDSIDVQMDFWDAVMKNEWSGPVYLELLNRVEFVRLDWSLPEGVDPDIDVYKPEEFAHRWPGYHRMCHFYAEQIFKHPRIRDLTYYMRLDTDSFILDPLCYDPIDKVHFEGKMYAYNRIFWDEPYVTRGMWNFIDDYARSHPEIEEQLARNQFPWPAGREYWAEHNITYDGLGVPSYYNNFEIVKLSAFLRPDVMAWLESIIVDPRHYYSLRWGDAPIRFATISMFYDLEKDVERMCAMNYWHAEHMVNNCPCIPFRPRPNTPYHVPTIPPQ